MEPMPPTTELLSIINELLVHLDVSKHGPGGTNLSCVRRAYDALAAEITSGERTEITASVARDMQTHGWNIGYPLLE